MFLGKQRFLIYLVKDTSDFLWYCIFILSERTKNFMIVIPEIFLHNWLHNRKKSATFIINSSTTVHVRHWLQAGLHGNSYWATPCFSISSGIDYKSCRLSTIIKLSYFLEREYHEISIIKLTGLIIMRFSIFYLCKKQQEISWKPTQFYCIIF